MSKEIKREYKSYILLFILTYSSTRLTEHVYNREGVYVRTSTVMTKSLIRKYYVVCKQPLFNNVRVDRRIYSPRHSTLCVRVHYSPEVSWKAELVGTCGIRRLRTQMNNTWHKQIARKTIARPILMDKHVLLTL